MKYGQNRCGIKLAEHGSAKAIKTALTMERVTIARGGGCVGNGGVAAEAAATTTGVYSF